MTERPSEQPGDTPETGIEESDPNADSPEGLAGEMGVSSERRGPVRGHTRGGHLRRGADPSRRGRARGRRTTGAVGVRRPAGAESRVPRRAQVRPGLEPRPRPVSTAPSGPLPRAAVRRRACAFGIDPLEDRLADVAQLLHLTPIECVDHVVPHGLDMSGCGLDDLAPALGRERGVGGPAILGTRPALHQPAALEPARPRARGAAGSRWSARPAPSSAGCAQAPRRASRGPGSRSGTAMRLAAAGRRARPGAARRLPSGAATPRSPGRPASSRPWAHRSPIVDATTNRPVTY